MPERRDGYTVYSEDEFHRMQRGATPVPVKSHTLTEDGRAETSKARAHHAPTMVETGVLDEQRTADSAVTLVRTMGVLLLMATFFGTLVPFLGGWAVFTALGPRWAWAWPPLPRDAMIRLGVAALAALAFQAPVSWAQWSFRARAVRWWRRRKEDGAEAVQASISWWIAYGVALLLSAAPSTYTYFKWVEPVIAALGPWWAGLIIVAIGVTIGDMIPEWIFVRRRAGGQRTGE